MKTIMVVDEEKSMLEDIKKFLKDDEYSIVTAENNREAIELITKDTEDNYGLILINTNHPESKKPAYFSMNPKSKINLDTSKEEKFLKKPFTRSELLEFLKKQSIEK